VFASAFANCLRFGGCPGGSRTAAPPDHDSVTALCIRGQACRSRARGR
jgi:hypothetical protein